ncbi:MAG: T9SS type A sorting domain-containing protein [Saprospiraceae bacterium]
MILYGMVHDGFTSTDEDLNNLLPRCYDLTVTDKSDNCEETFSFCIYDATSSSEESINNILSIFPNPARDKINIDITNNNNENSKIIIYNISGIQVYSSNIVNNNPTIYYI